MSKGTASVNATRCTGLGLMMESATVTVTSVVTLACGYHDGRSSDDAAHDTRRAWRVHPARPPGPGRHDRPLPVTLPAVSWLARADALPLAPDVTFLVGENGTDKSTLIEAIAVAAGSIPKAAVRTSASLPAPANPRWAIT
jgi:hypothetical protein